MGTQPVDGPEHLSVLSQGRLDTDSLRERHREESAKIVHASPILPGVIPMIEQAKENGLQVAVGSSSTHSWVDTHLKRLGIFDYFDHVICQDDVLSGRSKPYPDIFLKALEKLKVKREEAVVFEDSSNGVLAAQRAGIFVVGIPNQLTAKMGVKGDITVPSLAELSLNDLNKHVKKGR